MSYTMFCFARLENVIFLNAMLAKKTQTSGHAQIVVVMNEAI